MMVYFCKPSTPEMGIGGWPVQGCHRLIQNSGPVCDTWDPVSKMGGGEEGRIHRNSLLTVILGIVGVGYGIRFDGLLSMKWPQTLPLFDALGVLGGSKVVPGMGRSRCFPRIGSQP